MLGRVRCKLAKEARRIRKERKKVAKVELQCLIDDFNSGPCHGAPVAETEKHGGSEEVRTSPDTNENESDEKFWAILPEYSERHMHVQDVPSLPLRHFPGKVIQSRSNLLSRNLS